MSTTIDQRIVEMQFDNRQFESNVQTSLSTLDKLKKSLNLTGASKGLESVNEAAKNNNFGVLSGAVEQVGLKFNGMYTIADQALRNITNSVMNTSKRMMEAFTIEPIKTGLQEYETQINAVQTIMANTSHNGTTLNEVNNALDTLNTYADKTIYNFTEMTRNIGTFTAAGVNLQTSVESIQGIANLAAVSGSTSQQASTAMYQLSQALAAGKVSLMDWNSVVNAGMGGKVFQDALVRTSELLGTGAEAAIKAHGSFRESLTKGEWLTTDVLTETLKQFAGAYSEADLLAQGFTEQQAKDIAAMAVTAENAATKVKTFTQLMDTLKESVQSGWTQTWELIIGDFDEAKELWTSVSDTIGGFINNMSESRNNLLEGALNSPWEKLITKINEAGVETSTFENKVKELAKDRGLDVDELVKKYGSFEEACRSGAISSAILSKALKDLSGKTVDLSNVTENLKMGDVGDDVKKVQEALKNLGHNIGETGIDGMLGASTEAAIKAFQEANKLEVTGIVDEATLAALEKATTNTENLYQSCSGLLGKLDEFGGREMIIDGIKNAFEALVFVLKPIKAAFTDIFPPKTSDDLKGLIEGFHEFTKSLKPSMETIRKIHSVFKGFFSIVDIGLTIVKALAGGFFDLLGSLTGIGGGVLGIAAAFGNWITNIRTSVKETDIFGTAVDKVVGFLTNIINEIKNFGSALKESFAAPDTAGGIFGFFISLWNIVKKIGKGIATAVGSITSTIATAFGKGDIFEVFNSGLIAGVALSISKFVKTASEGFDNVGGFLENVIGILDDVRGCFQAYQDQLKAGTLMKIATAIGILAAAIFVISTIDSDKLAQSLGAITVLFGELLGSLAIFNKIGGTFKGTMKAIPLMIAMSSAILILSFALKNLSSLSWEGIAKGLVAIGALMAELSIFLATAKFSGKMTGTAFGIVLLSAAMIILAKAVEDFGSMSWEQIGKGLAAIGALLLEISFFTQLTGGAKKVFSTGAAMVLLGASMKIFASAMKDFATMSWGDIGKGLAAMGAALAEVGIAMRLMPKGSAFKAVGLVVAAAALKILFSSLSDFSSMDWGQIGRGLAAMGGALLELAIGLHLMNGTIGGSASLLIAAVALSAIAPVMVKLGNLSWEQIGKGLVTLAGAFLIMGVAGALIAPVVPALLGLSAAFLILGLGIAGLGAGLVMIGAGLTSISVALAAGAVSIVTGLTTIILGLLNLVPEIVQIIGEVILGVAAVLGDYAPQLAESFCKLIVGVVESLGTYGPQLVNSLLDLVIDLINGLANHMPQLIDAFANLIGKIFGGVVDALSKADPDKMLKGIAAVGLMSVVAYMLSGVLAVLPSAMLGLVGVGILIAELALVFAAIGQLAKIDGLEDGIAKAGDILNGIGKAIGGFIGGIGEGITESLVKMGDDIVAFMAKLNIASQMAKGIKSGSFDGVSDLIGVMGDIALTTVGTSISDMFTLGGTSMEKFETDGVAFFNAMKAISEASVGITLDEASIGSVITIATKLSELQSSLEPIGGVMDWFTGRDDLATFGTNAGQFMSSMGVSLGSLSGVTVNNEALTAIIDAATQLSTLQSSLESIGGVISWFTGRSDLATFGTNAGQFMGSMSTALSSLGDVTYNTEALTAIIDSATQLSGLQSSLESIGGVVDWFTGKDDLATFGTNVAEFLGSMGTALGSLSEGTYNTENLSAIIDAATQLSGLQSSLESIGGVVDWFTGKSDLGTFGTNVASFIGSMSTALGSLGDATYNSEALTAIINAATQLSGLQSSLESIGGVVDWFTGKDDLGTFGTNVASFISSMKTAFTDLGDTAINSEAMTSIIDAATKLAGLQETLTPMEGVIGWFTGRTDLGTFGTQIGEFATAMGKLRDGMGENGISESVITSITNTGAALVELNSALPEKGWFDSKEDLTDFSTHISNFATAISDFSTTCSSLNEEGINIAINAANRIKLLINTLANIDTSGVTTFTGVGSGGVGADGAAKDIADAMLTFSNTVSGINIEAVTTAVSSATKLKNLIASLVGLDTSGVDGFKTAITKLCSINLNDFKIPDLSGLGSSVISTIVSGVNSKASEMSAALSKAVNDALSKINSAKESFKTAGVALTNMLIVGMLEKVVMMKLAVTTAMSSAVSAINLYYESFKSAGKYVGDGLIAGLNAKKQEVYDAGYALGKKAKEGMKDGSGVQSPSIYGIETGEFIGEGLIIGMGHMIKSVYKSGKNLGQTASNAMTSTVSKIATAINTDIDSQPTIRPVLDLSDVQSGAGRIGNMLSGGYNLAVGTNMAGTIAANMNSRQNGTSMDDVVSAIDKLRNNLSGNSGPTYQVGGVTYDDGTNVATAVKSLIRAAKIDRRA